jgi:adenylylsulfate kinase
VPGSGKSTIAASLREQLATRDIDAAVLESDVLRRVFTYHPRYDEADREAFYHQMTWVGELLVVHGIPVIFDATANRRNYRERAHNSVLASKLRHIAHPVGATTLPCSRFDGYQLGVM